MIDSLRSYIPKVVEPEEEYEAALERISVLMNSDDDTDTLELLAVLVEDYERRHYPVAISASDQARVLIEIGKRMRALQQKYFSMRDRETLRQCIEVERQFDRMIEEMERSTDG